MSLDLSCVDLGKPDRIGKRGQGTQLLRHIDVGRPYRSQERDSWGSVDSRVTPVREVRGHRNVDERTHDCPTPRWTYKGGDIETPPRWGETDV